RLDSLFLADTIRRITPADSIYFSFFFQPGGAGVVDSYVWERIGNQPGVNDSLVLEFGYTVFEDSVYIIYWNHIWSTPGFSVDTWTSENPFEYFKQVMIPITDTNYLRNNFQFRFRNYASLEPQLGISGWEGNVDQWHIDYIRLDVGRNHEDKFTNDLAFVAPTTSFLKNYQAMPWNQFQPADIKSNFTNQLTNLNDRGGVRTSRYEYIITQNENVIDRYETGAIDIFPYVTHGIQTDPYQASPAISLNLTLTDTTTFKVTHIFQNAAGLDFSAVNDTFVFEQKFLDYYAYDDGTAEYGYCLNNQFRRAYFAMKFSLRVPDSLSAVRMWFNRTKNDENKEAQFTIVVWSDNNGQPGKDLYTLEGRKPKFDTVQFLDFVEYKFDEKVPVSGTFWVGFEQQDNVQLNIGFDQNTDSREFFRFNTRGIWETSVFKGTPMLRPVFGKEITALVCCAASTATIRPNPASDRIIVTSYELRVTNVEIYDIMGRRQKAEGGKQNGESSLEINISHLQAGIYFVRIYKENNSFETLKLIKN
ncbi:MAG: T9SS type A sorting domain-containing protein, partial [Bacteroidetes bacterium]|nr:T9SS type A sorting domain-containing protein [Bacteroidota bacterium]